MNGKYPWMKKLGYTLVLGSVITVIGCEDVSLVRRENIARNERYRDRDDRDVRRDRVYGSVQDVNERRSEIRVREDDGRTSVVRYDNRTRITDGNREIRPESLRSGDQVSIRVDRDSRGEQYAESIRVEDRRSSGR
jgi:hypothetical protein